MPPHNLPMTVMGAGLLWFGWFGFNAGSALEANGLAVSAFTATNTGAAAAALGFPVALKAVSSALVHKTDAGAVRLNLHHRDEVVAAAEAMAATLGARLEGFAVQAMVRGDAEVIVGARRDPQFGPVVLVGLGGIAVEILKDIALAPAPVAPERAQAMLDTLRTVPLFHGARGRPALDVPAIVHAVVRLSWLAADLGPRLVELEINPLIVRESGHGAIAVDARGVLAADKEPQP
jgi:acetyl-CoA synthetase (ADP-forming)